MITIFFTLSIDNFILVDVISMWDIMSFVFKNESTYGLDHLRYMVIYSYNNIQSSRILFN